MCTYHEHVRSMISICVEFEAGIGVEAGTVLTRHCKTANDIS